VDEFVRLLEAFNATVKKKAKGAGLPPTSDITQTAFINLIICDPPWGRLDVWWDKLCFEYYSLVIALANKFLTAKGVLIFIIPTDRFEDQDSILQTLWHLLRQSEPPWWVSSEPVIWVKGHTKLGINMKQAAGTTVNIVIAARSKEHTWHPYNQLVRTLFTNVMQVPLPAEETKNSCRNPAVKPVRLYSELIRSFSNPGEVVFDPGVGSGVCLRAAFMEGRSALGVDQCEEAVKEARTKLTAMQHEDAVIFAKNGEASRTPLQLPVVQPRAAAVDGRMARQGVKDVPTAVSGWT